MYDEIKARYDKGYVTDDQLDRYVTLGVITSEQAAQIRGGRIIDDGGTLYRVVPTDGVTPQEHQPPHGEGMLAVYRPIAPEHEGTLEDPIPWVYGMDCYEGKYYSYEGHVYKVAAGGSMIPCVCTPGTAGLWQWELIE